MVVRRKGAKRRRRQATAGTARCTMARTHCVMARGRYTATRSELAGLAPPSRPVWEMGDRPATGAPVSQSRPERDRQAEPQTSTTQSLRNGPVLVFCTRRPRRELWPCEQVLLRPYFCPPTPQRRQGSETQEKDQTQLRGARKDQGT